DVPARSAAPKCPPRTCPPPKWPPPKLPPPWLPAAPNAVPVASTSAKTAARAIRHALLRTFDFISFSLQQGTATSAPVTDGRGESVRGAPTGDACVGTGRTARRK